MTIQEIDGLIIRLCALVVAVGLIIGIAGMCSGCATRSVEAGGPGWSYHSDSSASPLHSSEQVRMQSQVPGYGYPGAYGSYGYGGPAPDFFGYVRTQYAGSEYDPAMAGAIRPPPPVPVPQSPAAAAPAAPAPQSGTDATLRADVDAVADAVVDLNQRVLPLEDMHCRSASRERRSRCRRGGSR